MAQTVTDDPVIAEIRKARWMISEECGHDPRRLVERYIRLQEAHKDRLMRNPEKAPPLTLR